MKFSQVIPFIIIASLVSCSSNAVEEETALYAFEETEIEVSISEEERELVAVVNAYRASIGLNRLIVDPKIYPYAAEHNAYMISENAISHKNFDTRSRKVMIRAMAVDVSENVARFFNNNLSVLNAWLNSPTHKETLEDRNFTHTII